MKGIPKFEDGEHLDQREFLEFWSDPNAVGLPFQKVEPLSFPERQMEEAERRQLVKLELVSQHNFTEQLFDGQLPNIVRGGRVDRFIQRQSFWKKSMPTYSPFGKTDTKTGQPVCLDWGQEGISDDIGMASIDAFIGSLARVAEHLPESGFMLRLYDSQFWEELERGDWDL